MPDVARAVSGIPRADPGGRVTPRFRHRLIRFRHFCSGSLALASLDRACRNLVPAFPQRSPPRLLPAAACGGLRSAPDPRTRRALLHLSYSCAPQTTHAALVTHAPFRTLPAGRRAGRIGWIPALGTPGFHRPLSDPSTDLQIRCHGSKRDGRDVPLPDLRSSRAAAFSQAARALGLSLPASPP